MFGLSKQARCVLEQINRRRGFDRFDSGRIVWDVLPVILAAVALDVDRDHSQLMSLSQSLFGEHGFVDIAQDLGAVVALVECQIGEVHVSKCVASHGEIKCDMTLDILADYSSNEQ